MAVTKVRREAKLRARDKRRLIGAALRRLREDAGLTAAAVADAVGIHRSYVAEVESGDVAASLEVLEAMTAVLGADLSMAVHPTTGPRIHDRFQAPMEEALLRRLHRRWGRSPEVPVLHPARGVIDLLLEDSIAPLHVASEIQSELRRLEQQIRWHREKELSLPSSAEWPPRACTNGEPQTSRLLVLRTSTAILDAARSYPEVLRAAYPARTEDVVAALTTPDAPWPGAGIVWVRVAGRDVRLLDGPPRGVLVGR
jgi:transcriptional regulator with XRE-family HTH domain